MGLADTARLIASLELDPRKFTKGLSAAEKALGRTEGRAFRAGQQIGTGVKRSLGIAAAGVGIIAANVALGVDSLLKLEQAQAQTNAVIKSTGGVAKISAAEVGNLAEKYEGLNATIGDEVIRSGENLLLTFTNIRGKAFEPTLRAALDINTALGKGPEGLTNTVRALGKALQDPLKGMTSLGRIGIKFTSAQTEAIQDLYKWTRKDLDALKDLTPAQRKQAIATHRQNADFKAQAAILKLVDERFGGSFLAQGATSAGKVAKFTDSIEDLQRAMAEALLPAIGNIADALTDLLADPAVIQGAKDLGKEIGNLFSKENVTKAAETIGKVMDGIKAAAPIIKSGLGVAADLIGKVVDAFQKLPPDVQKLAIGALAVNKLTGGLITNLAGALLGGALKTITAGNVTVIGASVTGPGGVGGAAPTATGVGGKAGTVLKALGVISIVGTAVAISAESIQGFVNKNQELKDKGLNEAEIAAIRYYSGSTANQQNMVKHLGRMPSKTDYDSGVAKLDASLKPIDRTVADAALKDQRQGERLVQSAQQTKASIDASKARQVAAINETRRETARSGYIMAAAARNAGERARAGALASAEAIRRKNLTANVNVVNKLNLSIRDTQRKLSFSQSMAIYG